MRKQPYNHIRVSSLYITNLAPNCYTKWWRPSKNQKEREKITINRLKRTWPITEEHYEGIFEEKMILSKGIKAFEIQEVLSTLQKRCKNFCSFERGRFFYHRSKASHKNLYHNYTVFEKICEYKKKYWINLSWIFFDGEIQFQTNSYTREFIKPDATLIDKNKNIYFLEIDMGNEPYQTLREKDKNYSIIIPRLIVSKKYDSINVLFFTKGSRIINLKRNNVFAHLDEKRWISFYEI